MSFFENTRKPVGLGGKIMVAMMNLGHSPVARWGLRFLKLTPDAKVLDCGCGGGANIKRLLKKCPEGIVKGIDYSPVSVEKSKKVNEAAIAEGRCTVLQGSVADMIFAGDWFDAVTAFETVYFWPDLPQCFREVYRVLKPGGTLLICNESNGDTDKDKKWTEIIGGMTIYKDAELKTYLEQAGLGRLRMLSHDQAGKAVHRDRFIIRLVVGGRKNATMPVLLFNFLSQCILRQGERLFRAGELVYAA